MIIPKNMKRYCPYCKKHTVHKVKDVSSGGKRGPLKRGGKSRTRKRGEWRGKGNLGRYSKTTNPKRKTKTTKKTNLVYTCKECGKSHMQKKGKRTGKLQIKNKQS
jgi:large subunit ribosomal protein L44e